MRKTRWVSLLVLLLLLLLHQNYWMWGSDGIVLGLPVNLLYHLGLCLLMPLVMLLILRGTADELSDRD